MARLKQIIEASWNRSPRETVERARTRVRRRLGRTPNHVPAAAALDVESDDALAVLAMSRLRNEHGSVGLLGSRAQTRHYADALHRISVPTIEASWSWGQSPHIEGVLSALLVCRIPSLPEHWEALTALRRSSRTPVYSVEQLLLPFTSLQWAQNRLAYYTHPLSAVVPYYIGEQEFQPIARLNEMYPLQGRTVVEFGPLEGSATAALVQAGVGRLVALEARAENFVKTLLAKEAMGWANVEMVMDDFHNADAERYGRFDLVFANGVYYHSVAPFHLLENMMSLSDNIMLGGYCATDDLPPGPFEVLEYRGREYRAKRHIEESETILAGINAIGYFFHPDDFKRFFIDEGYEVRLVTDEPQKKTAGRYVRILAEHPGEGRSAPEAE